MTIDTFTSIADSSSIKVLFVKQITGSVIFEDAIKQIENSINYYLSNLELNPNLKCDSIYSNRSLSETKPFKISTIYRTVCYYNTKTVLPNSLIRMDRVIIFIANGKKTCPMIQMCNEEAKDSGLSFVYRAYVDIDNMSKQIKLEFQDQTGNIFYSVGEFAENIVLRIFYKFNSTINMYVEQGYIQVPKTELSQEQILDIIKYKIIFARMYLVLGYPISSAMYYNSIVELIEDQDSDYSYFLAHCFEGQASLLYYFYNNSDNSFEWWEVVSNSLSSFTQELPPPLQVCIQSICCNQNNYVDTINNVQSRKQILFDIILKKLTLSLNLISKNYLSNGNLLTDNHLKLSHCNDPIVSIYELIIKKSRFLVEHFVNHFHLDRKILIDFLDPIIHLNLSPSPSRNDLDNYAMFLIGCAKILHAVKSNRRVGVILIKLSQLFNKNRMYYLSYYMSCAAYLWYKSIFSIAGSINQLEIINNLTTQILREDDNYSLHSQCMICNASNKSRIFIGNKYKYSIDTEHKFNTIFERYYVPGKQYLDSNYLQYLSIYKHDLSLNYSAFVPSEDPGPNQDHECSNTHQDLLDYLKPFVNSFVCYGVHSMLQAYRKFYLNTTESQKTRAYPSRYEMLALIIMIESSIFFGCASRSMTVLLLLLDNIVYFPPIFDYDTLKLIQSKCIDSLSILSNTIQLPIIRAPYYSITNCKSHAYTSIESFDKLLDTPVHTMHLLLVFDISFEQTPLITNCHKCNKEISISSIFSTNINECCSNCQGRTIKIDNSPWLTCRASNIQFLFDSKSIFLPECKWVQLKEEQVIKPDILNKSNQGKKNVFLYNPFEKRTCQDFNETCIRSKSNAEVHGEILWQAENQYTVYVSLFNPFLIPIILDCFSVITKGEVKCDISPVSVVIPPSSRFSTPGEVKVAITVIPKNSGYLSIIGVTYKFSGINYINFGSKLELVNSRNQFKQYLSIFVIPNILSTNHIVWEKTGQNQMCIDNSGKIIINSTQKHVLETEKKIRLLSTEVYVDQIESAHESFSLENITMRDQESIITVCYSSIYNLSRFKFLIIHIMDYNGKIFVSSNVLEIFSNISPFPRITNISLVPKLNFQPIYFDSSNNKWKVGNLWIIFTLENSSKIYPIEFFLDSNYFKKNRILLMPDRKSYRWVVETTVRNISELQNSPPVLRWRALYPNTLSDNNLESVATGNLSANILMPEFLSKYDFFVEIKSNGVQIENNQVVPMNSIVNVKIYAISEKHPKNVVNIKILPFGNTLKSKQLYLEYNENGIKENI
ncbi:putative zinc ribbon-containing protein [Cryptosporidium canis]|uniref:Zinc ribbon-containing protein n=1 Tax=Cryptosporidium canis TaxID=195482 RepID=A0ABQ8P861_9CRYT|nr:putative zinc ribbon-containing protein [Cryptosporidium canis]